MIARPADSYSPQLRTALVLTGTGTAGAYHAGVLRALHEAGVKLDVIAAHGVGVVAALFAAVDGAQRLWDEKGFWRAADVRSFYAWRPAARFALRAAVASVAVVAAPVVAMAAGLVVFPIDFVLKMALGHGAPRLVAAYMDAADAAFSPGGLPTWLPRLVVLTLGLAAVVALSAAWATGARPRPQRFRWRAVPSPFTSAATTHHCWRVMWDLLRGAAPLKQPPAADLARRYTELLSDNLGQPGFRELLLVVHDLDARRDLVFALVSPARRRDLVKRATTRAADVRRSEVFDLSGVGRDYLADAIAAALSVPVATDPHPIVFAPDAYWRGETHRACDRPGSLVRIFEELGTLGVDQAIVVSASPDSPGPHALTAPRGDPRGRVGEYLQSAEAAVVRDVTAGSLAGIARLFTIRPAHNPVGPFDFSGGYDDRSARRQPLVELMNGGYEDAYHQFIEPVVGASGERVGEGAL